MQTSLTSPEAPTTGTDPNVESWRQVSSRAVHPSAHSGDEPLVGVIAAGLAAVAMPWELAGDEGDTSSTERQYELLLATETYDAWLIHWPVGTGLDAHDHGGSTGAFAVVSGVLDEDVPGEGEGDGGADGGTVTRRVHAGESVAFGGDHVHAVVNRGVTGATSVHVYSPPLSSMSFYRESADGGYEVDRVDEVFGARMSLAMTETPAPEIPDTHGTSVATDRLLTEARARISTVDAQEAARLQRSGATLVDTRPAAQRAEHGAIAGAVVIERNVLEWRLDPAGDHRLADIDHDRPIVVFCQQGYASSLAVASLVDLGLSDVHDLGGGFAAWAQAGLPISPG